MTCRILRLSGSGFGGISGCARGTGWFGERPFWVVGGFLARGACPVMGFQEVRFGVASASEGEDGDACGEEQWMSWSLGILRLVGKRKAK